MKREYFVIGWLFDGSGSGPMKNVVLEVTDGKITAIQKAPPIDNPQEIVKDYSSCIVTPPFVDCRVDLGKSGSTSEKVRGEQLVSDYPDAREQIRQNLHYNYKHGITCLRDVGSRPGHIHQFLDEVPSEDRYDLRIQTAIGIDAPEKLLLSHENNLGSDQKVAWLLLDIAINEKNLNGVKSSDQQLSLIKKAKDLGLSIMVGAQGDSAVKKAIELSCSSLEYGDQMENDTLSLLAEHQITWMPCIYRLKAEVENRDLGLVSGSVDEAKRSYEHHLKLLSRAKRYGVKIGVGSDSGGSGINHGDSFAEEMRLIMQADYSLQETIAFATANGSRLLRTRESGMLEVGQPASFLVFRATPSMITRKLSFIEAMYTSGDLVFTKEIKKGGEPLARQ